MKFGTPTLSFFTPSYLSLECTKWSNNYTSKISSPLHFVSLLTPAKVCEVYIFLIVVCNLFMQVINQKRKDENLYCIHSTSAMTMSQTMIPSKQELTWLRQHYGLFRWISPSNFYLQLMLDIKVGNKLVHHMIVMQIIYPAKPELVQQVTVNVVFILFMWLIS